MQSKPSDSPIEVYDAAWEVLNEKYAYFEYKNIDWESLRLKYRSKVKLNSTSLELYDVLEDLLYQLKDGHTNLYAGFNSSRNWLWYLDSPVNFDATIIERNYLGKNYWISGGLQHTALKNNTIAYVRYSSFNGSIDYFNLVLERYKNCKGIIIDVRGNGGGSLDNSKKMACYLADKKRLALKTYYKTGKEHNNFEGPELYYIEPVKGSTFDKPIIILTNRMCYSATSFFVAMAKQIPNVTVLGDKTGGGAGLPVDCMLPNGWRLRFSGNYSLDADDFNFEYGSEPNERCDMDLVLKENGVDSIIERACQIINQKSI